LAQAIVAQTSINQWSLRQRPPRQFSRLSSTASSMPKSFAFVFPMASGHINPSLPIARGLVERGHQVHYVCAQQMRKAIEDTGAVFHAQIDVEPELYEGRAPDAFGALGSLQQEHGLQGDSISLVRLKLTSVQLELQIPGMLRLLREIGAAAVVYDPLFNVEAALAAKTIGIPAVPLLTIAGPGCWENMLAERFKPLTPEDVDIAVTQCAPNIAAVERIRKKYGIDLDLGLPRPFAVLPGVAAAQGSCLVTTSSDLSDPMSHALQEAYASHGLEFEFVGPLLDKPGAVRGGVFLNKAEECCQEPCSDDIVERVRAARTVGRAVVMVSMGTVITGSVPQYGWEGRIVDPDGRAHGLTGREICRAAWTGAFDAFGAASADEGPLLVVGLGPQPDPLGDLTVPPNAICAQTLPQVDILKIGVDVFLTHGGQNSFTESLAQGTPVVVCPGFGDQVINSRKAVDLGVGLKVDRPDPRVGEELAASERYRSDVRDALRSVYSEERFKQAAAECAERLRLAGGVEKSINLVLAVASRGQGVRLVDKAAGHVNPVAQASTTAHHLAGA